MDDSVETHVLFIILLVRHNTFWYLYAHSSLNICALDLFVCFFHILLQPGQLNKKLSGYFKNCLNIFHWNW